MSATLIKVAMIRGKDKLYLNCPCGAKPEISMENSKDITCACGKTYTYNGWIK